MILLFDMLPIVYGAIAFTVVIMLLTFGLIYAQRVLVPQGDVKIIINGDDEHPVLVSPGSSLLSTLSNQNLFLPSACGGGGATCTTSPS